MFDPSESIKLVKSIEKFRVLYDTEKYPSVECRGLAAKAWPIVAKEVGISESRAKQKWTNIKGSFKRYLKKKQIKKSAKEYYLADYLEFLMPYTKIDKTRVDGHRQAKIRPRENTSESIEPRALDEPSAGENVSEAASVNPDASSDFVVELVENSEDSNSVTSSTDTSDEVVVPAVMAPEVIVPVNVVPEVIVPENVVPDVIVPENAVPEMIVPAPGENPDWDFLSSTLLPEMRRMTESEKILFRYSVLCTMDQVLFEGHSHNDSD